MIYFDNAATTQLDPSVVDVMDDVLRNHYGNPSSVHAPGRDARVIIEDARRKVAAQLGAKPSQIFFTSCGTEALNTAIFGAVQSLGIQHVISSPIEHHAVIHSLDVVKKTTSVKVHMVRLLADGHIDMLHLQELLVENPQTLVCLMHANNEIGTLLNLEETAHLCAAHKAYLLIDTVQSLGKYPIDLGHLPVHFAACSSHKFHGPKGCGFLYLHPEIKIPPFIHGGGQERSMRSGTENTAGIAGLSTAFGLACSQMDQNRRTITEIRDAMVELLKAHCPGIAFNNDLTERGLYNLINVTFPESAVSDMLLQRLDMEGVCASGGSACASGAVTGSAVLQAIGRDKAGTAVRFSFSKFNTLSEVHECIRILKGILS